MAGSTSRFIGFHEMRARAGEAVNPHLTLLIEPLADALAFSCVDWGHGIHPRVNLTMAYVEALYCRLPVAERAALVGRQHIVFQAEDVPVSASSVSWERQVGWPIELVPDLHYFEAAGHPDFLPDVPAWHDRPNRFFWRGATTGTLLMGADQLEALPRYRLCRAARAALRDGAAQVDVGFVDVVQARSEEDRTAMGRRLADEGLIQSFVPLADQAGLARYVFDIDGNSNSWNFMAKLRLGCCVLKIGSRWEQWYTDRLLPWVHFVPVAPDLTDLAERMDWCLSHPDAAAKIAAAGRDLALAMNFDEEMATAAATLFRR